MKCEEVHGLGISECRCNANRVTRVWLYSTLCNLKVCMFVVCDGGILYVLYVAIGPTYVYVGCTKVWVLRCIVKGVAGLCVWRCM